MKAIVSIVLLCAAGLSATAQSKSGAKPTSTVKATGTSSNSNTSTSLKNLTDSASYAIGQNMAEAISKDLKNLNKQAFLDAIKTVFDGKQAKFEEADIRSILSRFSIAEEESRSKVTLDEGRAFLEKNKTKPGVKTTASGLQYEVLKEGTGIMPTAADTVVCNYIGMLIDSTEFDNSYERGQPLTIAVDGGVIRGWTEGLQLMKAGSKYRFYIPQELGYGLKGASNTIPGGSALIFDIELLDVKKGK